jgi:hypothetical protein
MPYSTQLYLLACPVNRSLHQLSNRELVFRQPKTEKSRRLIALTSSTASILKEYYKKQNKQRQSLGYDFLKDEDSVFCHYDGKPLLPNTVNRIEINELVLQTRTRQLLGQFANNVLDTVQVFVVTLILIENIL